MRRDDGRPGARAQEVRAGDGIESVRVEDERRTASPDDLRDQIPRPSGEPQPRTADDRRPSREELVERAPVPQHRRAVAVVGERGGHRLADVTFEDRLEARGDGERRQPGSGAAGALRREERRACLSARAGDDQHVPEAPLVRVARPRREEPADLLLPEERDARPDRRDRVGRNADVDDGEESRVLDTGMHELADLREAEGRGHRRPHRHAERHPRVGGETGCDVEGEDWRAAAIDGRDDVRREAAHGRVQPRAEQRVDDRRRAAAPLPERVDGGGRREIVHGPADTPPAREHPRRVVLHLLGTRREPDFDRHARAPQVSRDDEAIAAVVPTPAHDDHAAARMPQPLPQHARRAGAGALHEHVARRPVLDRPPIERAHLPGGDDDHGSLPRAIAIFISRTASAMPTTTARATRLWPMFSSTISGTATTGSTLSTVSPWPACTSKPRWRASAAAARNRSSSRALASPSRAFA